MSTKNLDIKDAKVVAKATDKFRPENILAGVLRDKDERNVYSIIAPYMLEASQAERDALAFELARMAEFLAQPQEQLDEQVKMLAEKVEQALSS